MLSAGALQSPQLLQLSGIGPADLLGKLGIPVVVDAPEVGRNLQDHYQARMIVRLKTTDFAERPGAHTRSSWRGWACNGCLRAPAP